MPNPQNLKPFKAGTVPNPKGRGHSKSKATIAKEIFAMAGVLPKNTMENLKQMYPEITERMTIGEIMFIFQSVKAIQKSDTAAFRAITDYLPDDISDSSDIELKAEGIGIRDAIIDKFSRFLDRENDWTILEGGSRSGKTYNFLLWAFMQTFKKRFDLSIIAPSFKMLELGSFVDVKEILTRFAPDIKIPERATKIDLYNGSRWVFEVVTDENEAKRNRDNVFVNEGDGIKEEVAMILGRAKGRKFVDFNPVKKFWVHKLIKEDESNLLKSVWQDNPYLTKNQLDWFRMLKERGENAEEGSPERYAYEVYYLGNYSLLSGKAYEFEDFDIIDRAPERFDFMLSYADPSLGTGADYFAACLFGIKGRTVYVVDVIFSQFVKSGGYVEKLNQWDRDSRTAIDHYSEGNGVSGVVTGYVNEHYQGVLNIVNNSTRKEADIIVYAPTAKKFKFVRSPKMIDFLTQCAAFPNYEHDDAPDCLARGAKLLLKYFDIL